MHSQRLVRIASFGLVLATLLSPRTISAQADRVDDLLPDSASTIRVMLPIVNVSATLVDAVAAFGRLTLDGAPLVSTPFILQTCPADANVPPLRIPGTTDANGAFAVTIPLGDETEVAVSLHYPAPVTPPVRGTLSEFESVCIGSMGVTLHMPPFEVAGIDLTSPGKGDAVDMPILFTWNSRAHPSPNELYQLVGEIHYNCATCEPVDVAAVALPFPSSSILLECVYAPAGTRGDVVSGHFRIMLANDLGVGFSEWHDIPIGVTVRC